MPRDVYVLVGDCLRAASATDRTLPFCRAAADLRFERAYAPSTWTLPVHASLYAGESPLEHGVTRWGDRLDADQARLPDAARRNGYLTATVGENPTFSARYGFDHGIDVPDDFANAKLWPSSVAPETAVDGLSPAAVPAVLGAIAGCDRPGRALLNACYAPLAYGRDWLRSPRTPWPTVGFPHHGERVLDHLLAVADERPDGAGLFAIANLLEPHNPHSVPPEGGARALGLEVPRSEQRRLATVDDNKLYYFGSPGAPPMPARATYGTWEAVLERREAIYEAQVREFDRLVERWAADLGEAFADALVVVTGDHGQLFGEEGAVGHHTSLHPHGIHVPLLVSLPDDWTGAGSTDGDRASSTDAADVGPGVADGTARTIESPVSLVGLSRALRGVVAGEIEDADAFVARLREDGPVLSAVDGPNWSVAALRATYGPDAVSDLAVRKVGLVDAECQVVLASPWADDRVAVTEYELVDGGRERVAAYEYDAWRASSAEAERLRAELDAPSPAERPVGGPAADDPLAAVAEWLAPERAAAETGPAANRLRHLGYR